MIKKLLSAAAMAVGLLGFAAPASADSVVLTDWYLDTTGTTNGSADATQVHSYLDITGRAFVQNTFSSATNFTFKEAGTFNVFSADTDTVVAPALTAQFTGTGSGTTAVAGGSLSFADGTLHIYSGVTLIGTFELVEGSAALNTNSTLPNGTVSIIFQATYLASGYWYDSTLTDLSTNTDVTLGFATTNAKIDSANPTAGTKIVNLYESEFAASTIGYTNGGASANGTVQNLVITNNGQYQLETKVPEPASLALVGLALVGAGFVRRRKAA